MSNFQSSDVINDFHIGDENNVIVKNEIYPICRFPGSHDLRRLTFSQPVVFKQTQPDTIEIINELGMVVFAFDTGDITEDNQTIEQFVTVNVQGTDLAVQTLGVRWTQNAGNVSANFAGNIFVYDAASKVEMG